VRPQNTTALEGYPVMMHCVAVGDPQPTIHWDKNNKVNGFDVQRFKVCTNYVIHHSPSILSLAV
jgi:PTK7 protein tyrosine kinase 7